MIKTVLRMGSVLSFLFPFVCGVWLLYAGLKSPTVEDVWIPFVLGSSLVGTAFFFGSILLVSAEKLCGADGGSATSR